MKFRKKPVVVEAEQWRGDNFDELREWSNGELCGYRANEGSRPWIETLEGLMHGNVGDWLIRGVKGEYYFCKPDIFDATYERVEARDRIAELERENRRLKQEWAIADGARSGEMVSDTVLENYMRMKDRIKELEAELAAVNTYRKSETAWRKRMQEYVGVNADVACSHDPGGLDVEKGAVVCRKCLAAQKAMERDEEANDAR